MPMQLDGSCYCGAVRSTLASHTPYPYQLCYCSICRKTAGGGGFAINIMGDVATMQVTGKEALRHYCAEIRDEAGHCEISSGQRHYCTHCGSALWMYDPQWPDLVHPFASAIDTELPAPPAKVHLMLGSKAAWVTPALGPDDDCFDEYPELSIEDWHRRRRLWID